MRTLTHFEYKGLGLQLNSQMRHLMVQCMTNECLIQECQNILKNCNFKISQEPTTYEEAIFNSYVPELLRRLGERPGN